MTSSPERTREGASFWPMGTADDPSALDRFLCSCASELTRRAADPQVAEVVREGARELETAVANMGAAFGQPSLVPVVTTLADAPPDPLTTAVIEAEPEIPWVPSHRMTDGGTEAALAPLNEVRDLGEVIVGLLALAPGATYPEHSHPPQEVYLPLSGAGRWRFGGSEDYRSLASDELVYNHPNDRHGIVAGNEPLLAMYVLWGASL